MNRRRRGAILTMAGGTCWGLSGSMGQYLFTEQGMDSRWLVPIRLGLAGLILFIYSLVRWKGLVIRPWKDRTERRELLVYGVLGVSLSQFFYFTTIQLSTAGAATILQDLSPVMILAVSCLMSHRRPTLRETLAIVMALAGVFLITTHGSLTHLSVSGTALLTGVISAFCVTIYNIAPARLLKRYSVIIPQSWAFLMGSALFTILFRPWMFHYIPTAAGWGGIAFVVIVGNVMAFPFYMQGVSDIGPEKGILYGFAEPVTAAIVSAVLLGTPFTVWDLIGFAAVFAMLVLISRENRARRDVKAA